MEVRCWGCSEDFQKPSKWNAIPDLDPAEYSTNTFVGAIAQKTGTINCRNFGMTRNYLSRFHTITNSHFDSF